MINKMMRKLSLGLFVLLLCIFMEAFVYAGTGYLYASTTPYNLYPRYYIYNADSTYSCTSIAGIMHHEAPSDNFYTIHWDPVEGYITPADSTAFLVSDSTIFFHGTYISANAPLAPTNLKSSTLSYAKIQLLWDDNANNEANYYLERKAGSEVNFSQIANLNSNVTCYLDTDLTPQTEYTYRVRAYNAAGYSDYSNIAVSTTSSGFTHPPVAGFVCAATTIFSGMCVDFHDVSQYGDTWEWIYGDTYHFYVRETSYFAFNNDTGRYWNIKQIVTNNLGASTASMDLLIDANPANIETKALNEGKLGYQITWNDNCNYEEGFELYRKVNNNPLVLAANLPANSTTFTDFGTDTTVGLDSTNQYGYFLRARSSDTVSNFIFSASYPIAQFYANPSCGYSNYGIMSVRFENNSLNATTYRWIFGDGGVGSMKDPILHMYSSPTSTVFYTILSCSNALGLWSSTTNTICINLPPVNLQAQRLNSYNVVLHWNSQSAFNDGYEIYRKTGTSSYELCTTLPGTCTTFTDTGLVGINQYTYKARATTYQAVSDFTNESSVPVNTGIESWNLFSMTHPAEVKSSEAILPEKSFLNRK